MDFKKFTVIKYGVCPFKSTRRIAFYISYLTQIRVDTNSNAFFYALLDLLSFLTKSTEITSTAGNTQPASSPF